jgi:hypothetical protein
MSADIDRNWERYRKVEKNADPTEISFTLVIFIK